MILLQPQYVQWVCCVAHPLRQLCITVYFSKTSLYSVQSKWRSHSVILAPLDAITPHSSLTWFINLNGVLQVVLYTAVQICCHLTVPLSLCVPLWQLTHHFVLSCPVLSCPVVDVHLIYTLSFFNNLNKYHWIVHSGEGYTSGWILIVVTSSAGLPVDMLAPAVELASGQHPWPTHGSQSINVQFVAAQSQEQHSEIVPLVSMNKMSFAWFSRLSLVCKGTDYFFNTAIRCNCFI